MASPEHVDEAAATTSSEQVAVRFLVVRGMPLVAVDVRNAPTDRAPARSGGLFQRVVEQGVPVLPRFLGVDLPRGAQVGWTLQASTLLLQEADGGDLLELPREAVDPAWVDRARALRGTMFVLGHDLGLASDDEPGAVAHKVDAAAADERLAGAIVGVAEPRVGLPLLPF